MGNTRQFTIKKVPKDKQYVPRGATKLEAKAKAAADAEFTPSKIGVPDPPTYEDQTLRDEQQVFRTEVLMTKGVRDKRQLMTLLDVTDHRQMDRYIKRVHARWELIGTSRDYTRHRGEGLQRLDLIEAELWSTVQKTDDPRVAIVALNTITTVQRHRVELLGLTPKVISSLIAEGDAGSDFSKRLATHDALAIVAARMMDKIEERMGVGARRYLPSEDSGEVIESGSD